MFRQQAVINTKSQPRFGFLSLTLSLISLQLIPAYFPDAHSWIYRLILVLILLPSLYLVAHNRKELFFGVLLAVPITLTGWSSEIVNETLRLYVNSVLHIVFMSYIAWYLLVYLFEKNEVTTDMIFAAICLYFLLGLIWNMIYFMVELHFPGSFNITTPPNAPDRQLLLEEFGYFSYVTLTTLGYGDVTPESRVARSWASMEAIIGQLYIAVVMARLVGLHVSQKISRS